MNENNGKVNWKHAFETVDQDEELLRIIIDASLIETKDKMQQLETAILAENHDETRRLAHSISATGRTFGIPSLDDFTKQIQEFAIEGNSESIRKLLPEIKVEIEQIASEFRTWMKDHPE